MECTAKHAQGVKMECTVKHAQGVKMECTANHAQGTGEVILDHLHSSEPNWHWNSFPVT